MDRALRRRTRVLLRGTFDRLELATGGLKHLTQREIRVRVRVMQDVRAAGLVIGNVIEINSIAILKSAIMAGMGATILPVAPVLPEIQHGQMRSVRINTPAISRTVVLCASRNIPLTNAANAIATLTQQVAADLCASGAWPGASLLTP